MEVDHAAENPQNPPVNPGAAADLEAKMAGVNINVHRAAGNTLTNLDKFSGDPKADVHDWINSAEALFEINAVPPELQGKLLLLRLDGPLRKRVLPFLGIEPQSTEGWPADKTTCALVCAAVKKAVGKGQSDYDKMNQLSKTKVDLLNGGHTAYLFKMETIKNSLTNPDSVSWQTFTFMVVKGSHPDFQRQTMYNQGKEWESYEEWRENFMNLAPTCDDWLQKKQQSHAAGGKSPHGGNFKGHFSKSPDRKGFKTGASSSPKGVSKPSKDHSHLTCAKCGGKGHLPWWVDRHTKKHLCPKWEVSKVKLPLLPISVSREKQQMLASTVCSVQTQLMSNLTTAAADTVRQQNSSSNSTISAPRCCDESVLTAAGLMTGRQLRKAAFQACLPHCDLLQSPTARTEFVDTLMSELLPTFIGCSAKGEDHLKCEAFKAADALAAQLHQPAHLAVAEDPSGTKPATEAPAARPAKAASTKEDVPTETNSVPELPVGYMPVARSVFEQVQAELLYPCTVDAFASQQTALCSTFCQPNAPIFEHTAPDCNVYWIHCPKQLQSDYLALYRKAKLRNPTIGACVLLPFKLPLTQIDSVKGFKLIHTYARNTLLFTDPLTGSAVRTKCTMALWYDPPVRIPAGPADTTADTTCQSIHASESLKPRLQVTATVAGVNTLALLDSGAAEHNFISADFCKRHGIKTTVTATPFTAVGVQNGAGAVTHAAKLTLKLATYTCQATFHVITLPATASFQLILGDAWLKNVKAVLDYSKDCCVLRHCNRKHVIPFAVSSSPTATLDTARSAPAPAAAAQAMSADAAAAAPAAAQSATAEPGSASNKPPSCIIGYTQAKRLMKDQVWHALVLVKPHGSDTTVPVTAVTPETASTTTPNSAELLPTEQVQDIVSAYPDVFTEAPPYGGSQIQLDTEVISVEPGAKPVLMPLFRYSPSELELMEQRIAELLALGYIQPSASPYGAPVLFVKKPRSTELRMVIDYRALNKLTRRNGFPLPRVDVLFDHLAGSKVFSLIDLRNAYHQCKLQPTDVPRSAFRTPFGHYEFLTLSFGLVNAPAAFQSVMNKIFSKLLYKCCVVYLDDILVFSKSAAEHALHLRAVLDILQANRLTVALNKCNLNQSSVLFLGHIISAQGVATDPTKVAALQQFPVPSDVSRLRSFLGTCNYFRRFVRKYAEVVRPLTNLLRNDAPFLWTAACQQAFEQVKSLLTTAPVLALPDWRSHKPFTMVCDASYEGVGGVLLQDGRPIAFESRKLNPAESNYSPTELEMLAVVHCCKVWRCYIEGRDVHVHTDHKPNVTFDTVHMTTRRHARWLDALQGHRLIWHYMKGAQNIADSLSRNPVSFVGLTLPTPAHFLGVVQATATPVAQLTDSLSFTAKIKESYAVDPWFQDSNNTSQLQLREGLFYKDQTLVLPADAELQRIAISECHDPPYVGHTGVTKTLALVRRYFWWPVGMAAAVRQYVSTCDSCQRNKGSNQKPGGLLRPLPIPADTWQSVGMDLVTDLPLTAEGHDSIVVFIDRLSKMVRIAPCTKDTTAEQFAELFYTQVFRSHGLPDELVHDRAPIWTSKFWQAFQKLLHMSSAMTSGYHPQTNGNTERVNRIMEDMLRHYIDAAQTKWASLLPLVEFAINDSWHESTQCTPFELNYGKRPNLPLDSILRGEGRVTTNCDTASERAEYIFAAVKKAKAALQAAQQRQKHNADTRRRAVEFAVGDEVFLFTSNIKLKFKGTPKLLPKWLGPFKVTAVINPVAYRLDLPSSLKLHNVFHVSLLKAVKTRPGNPSTVPPPPPIIIDGEYEYEVETVLSHRFLRNNKTEFLVKWLGYGPEHNTWENEADCANCPEKLSEYWDRVKSQKSAAQAAAQRKRARKRKASTQPSASVVAGSRRSQRRRL